MREPAYRAHHIASTTTHRVHSIQCLNDNGVVIALAATSDGEDCGLAVCGRDAETGVWSIRSVLATAEPTVRDINGAGQFVGWSLRAGRERVLIGRADPLQLDVWPHDSGATAIDATGRFVGYRRARGQISAFLQNGPDLIVLDAPPSANSQGYYATSICADVIAGSSFDASGTVLMWETSGRLVDRFNVDFGAPIRRTAAGHLLCDYGIVIHSEHMWFPNASRCGDFVARSINSSSDVVGFGRALDGSGQHACLWRPDGASYNLNDVTESSPQLREATAINDSGWISCSDARGNPILLEPIS